MSATFTVVRAAAGCGKTTDLARRYLELLADGVPVDRAIAITFTRRAAAELQERVSHALRACLDDSPGAQAAQKRLGAAWPLYAAAAPDDPAVIRDALAQLPDAPIGTTDAFIQRLLSEFALDAALPLPDGEPVPLDVPISPGLGTHRALDRVARRVLDPPDGQLDPDVHVLLRYFTLDQVLTQITWRSPLDDLPLAQSGTVLTQLAQDLGAALLPLGMEQRLGVTSDDVDGWTQAMERCTRGKARWAITSVAQWLAGGGDPAEAPFALAGWLEGLDGRRAVSKAVHGALAGSERDLGMGRVTLLEVVQALRYPYDNPRHVALADELRGARGRLRRRVVAAGLARAAAAGELGYDELIEAAIGLCETPPERLRHRFSALLVDEVQDANPAQLRLYRALADLGTDASPVRSYFVGDARQSIYLFRDAEPAGLADLEREGDRRGQQAVDLLVNHRSSPELVSAQRALFSTLADPMRERRWVPVSSLTALRSDPELASLTLSAAHHDPADPVWVVTADGIDHREADRRALHAFLQRVQTAWSTTEGGNDTAVVLAPTWDAARRACDQLRRWADSSEVAHVDGGAGWTHGRVGTDLSQWLRALLDPSDAVAWLAVWKHPSIGLSDAGLARVTHGVGLRVDSEQGLVEAPPWCHTLGHLVDCDVLVEPHLVSDQQSFQRARDHLRQARSRMGLGPTADWLDALVTQLAWRPVLAVGPGGLDDVARLEVLLDWVRTLDDDGVAPEDVLATLADPSKRADTPHVHLERPGQHVLCTTVFQAKGLAWDHVAVLQPGMIRSRRSSDTPVSWMHVGGERVRVEGIRFDPTGGITPHHDPLGRLGVKLQELRSEEESARILYVAITRARRSVTLGLPPPNRRDSEVKGIAPILRREWGRADPPLEGVAVVVRSEPSAAVRRDAGWCRPTPGAPWGEPVAPADSGWQERAPSNFGAHLGPAGRQRVADGVLARIRLGNGLHCGGPSHAPPGTDVRTGLPLPGHPLEHLCPADWGTLAHGWFAAWRFAGEPDPEAIDRYLTHEWGAADPGVRGWLVAVCRALSTVRGPLWECVTHPDAVLHFELPFVGLGGRASPVVLSGRMDLLVERNRRLTVIDFKAGARVPTGFHDLVSAGGLRTYGPQLEAYGDALRAMGRAVEAVALWYVRTGTSVRWTP